MSFSNIYCKSILFALEFVDVDPVVAEESIPNNADTGTRESTFDEKLQMVATRKDSNDSLNLTPLTPSLQCFE